MSRKVRKWSIEVVQVLRPMQHLVRPQARHLYRSRHGIWYVRWVVPADLRARFPALPKELKRSTKTSETRSARRFARDFLGQCISRFTSYGLDMTDSSDDRLDAILGSLIRRPFAGDARPGVDPRLVAPMVVERDPATRRITRFETQPHDIDPAKLINELLRAEREAEASEPLQQAPQPTPGTHPPIVTLAPASPVCPTGGARNWLSEAVERYLKSLKRKGKHAERTLTYTIAPSLRVFRELISQERRPSDNADCVGTWDISLDELTPQRIDDFVDGFWNFPDRQGKRPGSADAKDVVLEGGPPQARKNAVKRLNHILGLLTFLESRQNELQPGVLAHLKTALEGMAPEHDGAGSVAFSAGELHRIFHPRVYAAHAAGDAARYWMPLLGRYLGCRLNELAQAEIADIVAVDGVPCLYVNDTELDEQGRPVPEDKKRKRVKTPACIRKLPLHPQLIRLGFLDYVAGRRSAGKKNLFELTWTSKHGYGRDPGEDFRILTKAVLVWERRSKVFHSFRATISQELERQGLDGTLNDRFLGHKVDTIRAQHYGRNNDGTTLPIRLVHDVLCKIVGEPDVPTWAEVLKANRRHLKPICTELGLLSVTGSEGSDIVSNV